MSLLVPRVAHIVAPVVAVVVVVAGPAAIAAVADHYCY